MMKKKGQGLSLNMVVVGAISIVVVVVIIIFLMSNMQEQAKQREYASGASDCDGTIRNSVTECDMTGGKVLSGNYKNLNPGQVCCTK